jgi:8-oxo-dGTP pyrophosphatase MutT (NUDIX family)
LKFDLAVTRLERGLHEPLPGADAQLSLAPSPRHGWDPGRIPDDCRVGAGLLLVFPIEDEAHVLLTERHEDLPHHAGQVSLPGGAVENGESVVQAALREAAEETALDARTVRVLGTLTPLHIPVSGFVLHPVVGVVGKRPVLRARPEEVARLFETPIGVLADAARWADDELVLGGAPHRVPHLDLEGARLWGATAMVLAEFLEVLGVAPRGRAG